MASSPRPTCSYHAETDSSDYDEVRYGGGRTRSYLLQTLEQSGKCDSRLAHSAQFGHQSWVCKRAGSELRTSQTANGGARASPASRSVGASQSSPLDGPPGTGSAPPRASSC